MALGDATGGGVAFDGPGVELPEAVTDTML